MKKALIMQGGWEGHEPKVVSKRLATMLENNGYSCEITDKESVFDDVDYLKSLDLIVMCLSRGTITREQSNNVCAAIESGVGMVGSHVGLVDSFRDDAQWQFMAGGQWVSHPGGTQVKYNVNIVKDAPISLIEDLSDFPVCSEQYYLHVDPAVNVLATTEFGSNMENKPVTMPVVWTKKWGKGKIFYSSLGHNNAFFEECPTAKVIIERGMLWASK